MKFEISDLCVMCGTCEAECPENAIIEGEDQYYIQLENCSNCGTCEETCPVDAVSSVSN